MKGSRNGRTLLATGLAPRPTFPYNNEISYFSDAIQLWSKVFNVVKQNVRRPFGVVPRFIFSSKSKLWKLYVQVELSLCDSERNRNLVESEDIKPLVSR